MTYKNQNNKTRLYNISYINYIISIVALISILLSPVIYAGSINSNISQLDPQNKLWNLHPPFYEKDLYTALLEGSKIESVDVTLTDETGDTSGSPTAADASEVDFASVPVDDPDSADPPQDTEDEQATNESFANWGSFKAYMDYRTLTDTSSKQYDIQCEAYTGDYGCRMSNDMFIVATGSYYGEVGDTLEITLEDGSTLLAIKGDEKADCDTDADNRVCIHNNSIIEFIVDTDAMDPLARTMGDMSAVDALAGDVVKIEIV